MILIILNNNNNYNSNVIIPVKFQYEEHVLVHCYVLTSDYERPYLLRHLQNQLLLVSPILTKCFDNIKSYLRNKRRINFIPVKSYSSGRNENNLNSTNKLTSASKNINLFNIIQYYHYYLDLCQKWNFSCEIIKFNKFFIIFIVSII